MKDYRLTNYELEFMDVIWNLGEATVQDVCAGLSRELAYTTVMTTLTLLASKKKVLKRVKRGRAFVYRPVVSRDQVSRSMLHNLRRVLFGDAFPSLVLSMLSRENISDDDIAALKTAINKLESKQ